MIDITNPRVIKFLNESYGKESKLRIRWFFVNKEKIFKAAGHGTELKGISTRDVLTADILPGVEALAVQHKESAENRRTVPLRDSKEIIGIKHMKKTHSIKDVGLATMPDPKLDRPDADLRIDPVMRPVPAAVNEIIYKSKPDYGRLEYLHARSKVNQEDKSTHSVLKSETAVHRFYFNECTSWDYGWRLRDSRLPVLARKGPNRCRYCALAREAVSRSGPQPDPAHYNPPAEQPNFCSIIN